MVGREVRNYREVAHELARPVKLEARELQHDEVVVASRRVRDGVANVSAGHDGISELFKEVAYHRGRSGLSVASRHADDDARKVRIYEVELARHPHAAFYGLRHNRSLRRNSRADDHLVGFERALRVAAALVIYSGAFEELFRLFGKLLRVGDEDLRAELRRELSERASAHARSDDRYPFALNLRFLTHLTSPAAFFIKTPICNDSSNQ